MSIKKTILTTLAFFSLLIGYSCAPVAYRAGLSFGPSESKWVSQTLNRLTLEEKIGQMIVCSYSGRFLNRESQKLQRLKSLVVNSKIGGLILFGGNVYETALLTNSLQKLAKVPLLIASDLERGLGNQIEGATQFPPLMALGAIDSKEQAYLMGKVTAIEARACGIHLTYAPVVDVNINPLNPIINTRSFGEKPELVSHLANAFIRGCQENGLLATAKHFPGHGDTDLDSHSLLPTVKADLNRLEKVELFPFHQAIKAGVSAIMTAHLQLPALDSTPNLPATLSPRIITGILRGKLGFKGLIVTDAMGMGGITTLYSPPEAALKAILAGVDMILLPPQPEKVIESLIQAARRGDIPITRINSSVKRVLEAKAKVGLHRQKLVDINILDKKIGAPLHLQLAQRMFENAVTLVKNEHQLLPISPLKQKVAVFSLSSDPGGYFAGRTFALEVEKRSPEVLSFFADAYTGKKFLNEDIAQAQQADVIIFALFSSLRAGKGSVDLCPRHADLIRQAASGEIPAVVISFGSPYFLLHFPEVDGYLCAYRSSPEAQVAAAKAIFGEIDIKGKLPVSIPGLYPIGHGMILPKKQNNNYSEFSSFK
ncbi:MAG: glycoside hydrolase family 3 N-terminal domain-containing protein [Candidatus Aminicenantales bacterium]